MWTNITHQPFYDFLISKFAFQSGSQIIFSSGYASADTTGLGSAGLSAPQAVDNSLYYNPYPSGGGYDYEAYPVLPQGEQDRWSNN